MKGEICKQYICKQLTHRVFTQICFCYFQKPINDLLKELKHFIPQESFRGVYRHALGFISPFDTCSAFALGPELNDAIFLDQLLHFSALMEYCFAYSKTQIYTFLVAALTNNGVLVDYLNIMKEMKSQLDRVQSFFDAHIDLLEEVRKTPPDAASSSSSSKSTIDNQGKSEGRPQGAHGNSHLFLTIMTYLIK